MAIGKTNAVGITPSGSITITENGTTDVTNYANAIVLVQDSGLPIEVATTAEMNALLIADNVGKIYQFTGTTDATYTNGELYEVVDEE